MKARSGLSNTRALKAFGSDAMNVLESTTIVGGRRLLGTHALRGWHIKHCTFRLASLGYNRKLMGDTIDFVEDCVIQNCQLERCGMGVAEIHSTTVSGIRGDLLICWGTLFDRVKIVGQFDKLMLHGIPSTRAGEMELRKYAGRKEKFYAKVPWAIDVSEALFEDFSIRTDAVPLEKMILDPESQFVLSGRIFEGVPLSSLGVSTYTKTVIQAMLDEKVSNALLVAPKLDTKLFDAVRADAARMAELGLLAAAGRG